MTTILVQLIWVTGHKKVRLTSLNKGVNDFDVHVI